MTMLLSPEEVAEQLGGHIAARTLRNWAYQRRIPCIRNGRKILFKREHVDRILAQLEQKPLRAVAETRAA